MQLSHGMTYAQLWDFYVVESGYDLPQFFTEILNNKHYQLSSVFSP
jgi:hypothetical protein